MQWDKDKITFKALKNIGMAPEKLYRNTFDSEDDYPTGSRNVSHCQQQQSYSGLLSPGRSNSTYFWNDSWVQIFHS